MDAAAAAAAAVAATNSRMDAMEQNQITMTTQLAGIAQQLQVLLAGAGGAGGSGSSGGAGGSSSSGGGSGLSGGVGGSGSSGGVGTVPHPAAVTTSQRRRIDPSCLDKLPGDASLSQLRSWTNRWNDFSQLNQLSVYPVNEQMAAFRMVLDPAMHQVVEVALGISLTSVVTPADVLDQIKDYIRSKCNIALDRVAFEECKQGTTETFDEFYIRLKNLAEAANLCIACLDERMATRIMAGIQDAETKRRLLAISPFPTSQQTINICRSKELARANERSLSGPA